jgi:hypothetical protein
VNTQTPAEQVAERSAEAYPALSAAAAAVGLQNHRQALSSHEQRVRDSHAAQMRAIGMEPTGSPDEVGDILITGDITASDPQQVVNSLRGVRQTPQHSPRKLLPLAMLVAGSLAGGATLPSLLPYIAQLVNGQVTDQSASGIVSPSHTETLIENNYPMQIYREP